MNKIIFSILLLLTTLSTTRANAMETPPPVGDSSCTYTLYLTDYDGDGWNGASVRITDLTTEEYTDFTIDLNGWFFFDVVNETDTFNVIDGHQYSISWNSGQYDYECSFSLRDNLGELVYEYDPYSYDPWGATPPSGTTLFVFTAMCTDSMCTRPTNLRIVSHSPSTATLQWTNNDSNIHLYKLLYGTNADPDSMYNVIVNDTTYTLTNLSPNSTYYVQLFTICDSDTYSRYFQTIDVFTGYCIPLVDVWYGSFLRHLSFGNITGVMIDTVYAYEYADRHNQIGSCVAGDTLNISATFEWENPKIFVWVDWNNNYQFEQNELIASYLNSEYFEGTRTRQLSYLIPSTCPSGYYRLRLITTYSESDIPDPCLWVLDARDYTLQVTGTETSISHIYIDSMEYGTISINGNQYFPSGSSVENGSTITISATPNPNYLLQYLIVNNDTVNSPYTMIVTNDVYIQASFVLTLPDLHVTSIINSTPVAGGNFTVEWTVKNDGYGTTPQGKTWYDYLFLASDTEVQLADSVVMYGHLGTFQNLQSLNTGQYYTNNASVTIPQDLFGNYYLFVLSDQAEAFNIDFSETGGIAPIPYTPNVSGTPYHYFIGNSNYNDSITEIEENDNFFYKMITIQPPPSPDLSVTHVSHPIDAFSNTDIPISWTVSNQGQVTATGRWQDKIYIQTNASNSLSNAILLASIERSDTLPAGSTYQASTIVHIPISYMGDYYIVVATDADDDVYESIYEINNSMCSDRAISVVLSPLADLMATNITVADTVAANTHTNIQWTCSNEGLSTTETNRWYDAIYFSEDSTLDVHSDIRIEAILHRGILEMDSSYHVSANVHIPNLASGQYYIFVKVDDIESVYEYLNEPNNMIRRQQPIFVTQPDFSATSVTIPDTGWSGRDIHSTFTLHNVGESNFSGEIPVRITIMNDQDSTFLFDGSVSVNIPIDDSTVITQTLRIPQGQYGDYYCHVDIGHISSVIELSYSNNHAVSTSPLHINLSPYPDLVVSNIEVPDTVNTGQSIQINYIIENHGNDMANGYNTSQILFYKIPDGTCYIIPSSDYQRITVAPDTPMSYYQTGIIPSNIPAGSYNVSVKVDANDVFYEYNGENNNTGSGEVCVVNVYPQDLQLLQIDGPDTVIWGQTARYILQVKNNSLVPTLQNRWSDKLKLVLGSNEQSVRSSHQGVLPPDSVYDNTISIIIPYGSPATASIEAVVDDDYINPDINRSNNQLSKNIVIRSVPTPDLVVTNVEVLDPPISGQPIRIAYNVINMGQDSIVNKAWTDALFLSKTQAHDSIGPEVKTKSQHRTLRVGEGYRDTITDVQVRIPNHGLYHVMVNANKNKNYYESRWENNIAHCSINVTLPPPGDLIVRNITHSDTILSGNNINATWTIVNIGVDSIRGRGLSSLVYLSQDTLFDVNDKRIGIVENDYTALAPNDSIVQSFSGRLSGIAEGDYHLIVKTDVRNVFYEDSDDNNDAVGINTTHIKVKELPFDSLLLDSLYNNLPNDYVLRTREYRNETARIQVTSQDSSLGTRNTIYVKHNGAGSNLNYTYSSIAQNTSSPYLYIPHTQDSLYYVSIYGVAAAERQDISVETNILSFELNEINPTESGNNGNITLELLGSHFRPDMKVFLTKNNDTIYANKIIYNNYYQVFAKFTFNHIDTGYYNIEVLNFCEGENMLAHAFHVTDNSFEDISYNMIYPASPRSNRTISMVLEFGNIGNMDIVSPIIEITSAGGSYIALSADELNEKKQILQIPLNIEGEPQGVLRPGKIGRITIYGYTAGQLLFLINRIK